MGFNSSFKSVMFLYNYNEEQLVLYSRDLRWIRSWLECMIAKYRMALCTWWHELCTLTLDLNEYLDYFTMQADCSAVDNIKLLVHTKLQIA